MEKIRGEIKEIEARSKMKPKQDGSADETDETRKAPGRSQSVSTDVGRKRQVTMKQSVCHTCAGCEAKKGCEEIDKRKKVQKPGGNVNVAKEAGNLTRRRHSQSEAAKEAGRGCEKRKVAGNVASGEGGQEDEGRVKEN